MSSKKQANQVWKTIRIKKMINLPPRINDVQTGSPIFTSTDVELSMARAGCDPFGASIPKEGDQNIVGGQFGRNVVSGAIEVEGSLVVAYPAMYLRFKLKKTEKQDGTIDPPPRGTDERSRSDPGWTRARGPLTMDWTDNRSTTDRSLPTTSHNKPYIMSQTCLEILATALTGSDNEKKTSSLLGLKDELEGLDAVPDSSSLVPLLKTAMESSNGHVSFAALSCIPSMVKGFVTQDHQNSLKQIVTMLYAPSSGSVVAFLGDSKQRVRETARAALCAACAAACEAHLQSSHPPGPNEVLQELERIAKEQGFANKNPRARVQILHYVRELRSRYPTVFQLRTYLPSMVSLLEDSDPSVRSGAIEVIIAVFQDPSIPASARADLKNELAKQSTRKTTVDAILPKVFELQNLTSPDFPLSRAGSISPPRQVSSSRKQGDDHGSFASMATSAMSSSVNLGSSLPASSATDGGSSSVVVRPVYITSSRELEAEFTKMIPAWEGKETEHNWQAREGNVNTLRGMIKSGAHLQYASDFVAGLKLVSDGLLKSLATLRTTMAVAACNFLHESASLGSAFDPLLDTFLPPLLRMAAQTKKIVFQASQAAATALIQSTSYYTRTLQYLLTSVNEKTVQARTAGICRLKEFVEVHGQRSKSQIESGGGLSLIDQALKKTLADPSPLVRQTAREVYWICAKIWPGMSEALMKTLDGPTRKQLEKASSGISSSASTVKPPTEPAQRISVRSMIKSTRATRIVSGPVLAASDRPIVAAANRRSDTSFNAPPPNRQHFGRNQPLDSRLPDSSRSSVLSGTSPPGQSAVTPPRQAAPSRSSRLPHPASGANPSVSPLRKSLSVKSPASTHVSLKTPQSSRMQAVSRRPSSSTSDSGPTSRLFRPVKGNEENVKMIHPYDLAQLDHHHHHVVGSPSALEETIVEDAMKAQAEQAESAAHRLLELTEDEEFESTPLVPLGPGGILLSNQNEMMSTSTHDPEALRELNLAKLAKVNKFEDVSVWKKMFENSPAPPPTSSQGHHLVTDLRNRMRDSWWHRQAEMTMCIASTQLSFEQISDLVNEISNPDHHPESKVYVDLAQACAEHRFVNPTGGDDLRKQEVFEFWSRDGLFDRLFDGLKDRLGKEDVPNSARDNQLILLRALVLYEAPLIAGQETELCTMLLKVVQWAESTVFIACEAIGLMWVEQTDPVYGLSCLKSAVEMIKHQDEQSHQFYASIRWAVTCVGEYFGKLPVEIVEEELPKAGELIKQALVSQDPETRMSAVMSLVVANGVMKDEKAVMGILGDLTRAQEALLTYYLTPGQPLLSGSDT